MTKSTSRILSLIFCLPLALSLWAVDASYYSSYINNKSGDALFTGVHNVTKVGYSSLSYNGLWTAYGSTDLYPSGHSLAGKIWDMYGGCSFTYSSKQCGTYKSECDCYNREHSIPKSWFGSSESTNTPGTDIFHVVPTDGKVNGMRSNYAFGEVNSATYSYNGSKLGTAKSITIANTIMSANEVTKSCSSSPVFEPIDEYKGDFARGYLGALLKWEGDYQAFTSGDGSSIFSGTYTSAGLYGLTQYGVALLLKWHRQDPVSQKEIDRNNGIQSTQGNRNPFIDYPILAEYIWGKYAGQTFSLDNAVGSFDTSNFTPGVSDGDKTNSTDPTISVSSNDIVLDKTNNGSISMMTFTITGANLTGSISIAKSGSNYITVSPTSISAANANKTNTITITYAPLAQGTHNATLTITSSGATSKSVTISGTCANVYTATWYAQEAIHHTSTAESGESPAVPALNPDDCSTDRVIVGWTDDADYNSDDDSGLFTTVAPAISGNISFYAVYADATTQGGGGSGSDEFNCPAGSVVNESVTATTDNFTIVHAKGTSSNSPASYSPWRIYANNTVTISGSYVITSVVLTCGSDSYATVASNATLTATGGSASASASSSTCTITLTGDVTSLVIQPSAQTRWSKIVINYAGGGSTTYSNYSTLCTACTPTTPTATFNNSTVSLNKDDVFTQAVSTNSNGAVSYSSSNTTVADVDVLSGTVTAKSAGTARITASIAASTCYLAKTAYYDITVYDFHATAATNVTNNSFTANWTEAGVANYSLDVYYGTTTSSTVSRDTTIAYDFTTALTWTANDVFGTSGIWTQSTTYGAVGKGKSGTASESWLISPELDLSDVTTATLAMNHTVRYGATNQLSVKYSIDGGSNWSDITLDEWGDVGSWDFVDAAADLSILCGEASVKFAFVYTCTTSSYSTWEIKTFNISGKYNKTTTVSSIEHLSGYPKNVTGTSASVTGLDPSTTYKYTVTPEGGAASEEIEVTTVSEPACEATITINSNNDNWGTADFDE